MLNNRFPPFPGSPARNLPRWLLLCYGLLVVLFLAGGAALGVLWGFQFNLPRIQSLEDFRPDVITDIYADDNKVIVEFSVERRIIVPYEDIPPYLLNAILSAEDDQQR